MQTSPSVSTVAPVRYPVFSEPRLPFEFDEKGFPIPVDGLRVTEEMYWEHFAYHPHYSIELNDGLLEIKEMSVYSTHLVSQWFEELLTEYMRSHPGVQMTESEPIIEIETPDKKTDRKPDMGVVSAENPQRIPDLGGIYSGTLDLCVEILSDSKKEIEDRDRVDKVIEYAIAGIREFYILHWDSTKCAFYRLERGKYKQVKPKDGIFRSSVLPGFQFRISDLFHRPSPEEMARDDVYKSFVGLEIQKQTARAEKETARAEEETARAEAAEQEKEKEKFRADAAEREKEKERQEKEKEKVRADSAEREKEKERQEKEKEKARAEAAEKKILQEKRRADSSDEKNRKIQEWLKKQGIDPENIPS